MYKSSKYNLYFYNEDKELLILNTRTQNKACIAEKYALNAEKLFKGEIAIDDSNMFQLELIKKGFLIPEEYDELRWVEMKHNEAVFGTDSLSVEILPTNDCNLRCVYCFEKPIKSEMNEQTEEKIIRFLKRKIPKLKEFRLDWFGGEPLLAKKSVIRISEEANRLCRKYGVPMYGTISTNGTLLDVETFKSLIKNRVIEFQICIDGPKEFHNLTRPHYKEEDSYETIMNNLKAIKKEVKVNYFRIAIRCNITPKVLPHLQEHIIDLSEIFGGDNRFNILFQGVNDWGGERIHQENVLIQRKNVYHKYYNMAKNAGMASAEYLPFTPFKYCPGYKKNGFVINYDGSLYKCSLALANEENDIINKIGYLSESGEAIIDESVVSQWLLSEPLLRPECKLCVIAPLCMGGHCPYLKNINKVTKCNMEMREMIITGLECMHEANQLEVIGAER